MGFQHEAEKTEDTTAEVEPVVSTYLVLRLPDEYKSGEPLSGESAAHGDGISIVGMSTQTGDAFSGAERRSIREVAQRPGRYVAVLVHTTDEDNWRHPGHEVSLEVL